MALNVSGITTKGNIGRVEISTNETGCVCVVRIWIGENIDEYDPDIEVKVMGDVSSDCLY